MGYKGQVQLKASDIKRQTITGSTSATHTLTWSPPNEQSLVITLNGVKQHDASYSITAPNTLVLSAALVATDEMEIIGINDIGTTITPAQNSVTADTIADGVITNAKINASAAIAQSKLSLDITNSDVNASAAIALSKLATDPSNASNLASGTVPTARLGSGTASSSVFLRGDQSWAETVGGITHASIWRLTTGFTGPSDPISSNLEVTDSAGYTSIGSDMTESSGVFTFPATGIWRISSYAQLYIGNGQVRYFLIDIKTTTNNGSAWTENGGVMQMLPEATSGHYAGVTNTIQFDVTDTTTHKVSFRAAMQGSSGEWVGSSTSYQTYFTFTRLADT